MMTITAEVYEIALLVIAVGFIVFVIAFVPALMQFRRTVKAVEDLSIESRKTMEVVNFILQKTSANAGDVEEVVKKFKNVGLKYSSLLELVADSLRSPLITLLSLIVGMEFGVKHFMKSTCKDECKDEGGEQDVKR